MKTVVGNKTEEMSKTEFGELCSKFEKVVVDLGTGDGRYVFKSAQKNTGNLYVGIDPSQKQLAIYSKKAVKNKLENTLFVVGSIEVYPEELSGVANKVLIILPWGTLLQSIVNLDGQALENIGSTIKNGGQLEIIFGYSQDAEPTEVERLGLNKLDINYIYSTMIPKFTMLGYKIDCVEKLTKKQLDQFETTWSKKLRFGQDRPIFHLKLQK